MNIYMEIDAVSFSEEVSQQGVLKPQYLLSQWETTEKFMEAEFLEQKQYSMYRQLCDNLSVQASWAKMPPYVFGVYTVLIL